MRMSSDQQDTGDEIPLSAFLIDAERQQSYAPLTVGDDNCIAGGNVPAKDTRFLDGLRGIAALCVFNQHLMLSTDHHHGFAENGHYYFISLPFIRIFYSGGAAAVAIFFVLSGYVLSQSALRMIQNQELRKCKYHLLAAIVRRPIRLYLPCFIVTLGVALLMHVPLDIYPEVPWGHPQSSLISELLHWLLETLKFFNPFRGHEWKSGSFSYDLILWTIPIELNGSVFVYCLCATSCFLRISPSWMTILSLSITAVSLWLSWWAGACFAAGFALSVIDIHSLDDLYCYLHMRMWISTLLIHGFLVTGCYLLCQPAFDGHVEVSAQTPGWQLLTSVIPRTYNGDNYYRFFHSCGAILLLHATMRLHWVQYILSTRPLQNLGHVSFMLYILHWPIIMCADRVRRIIGSGGFLPHTYWTDDLLHIHDIGPKGLSLRWVLEWTVILSFTLSIAHVGTIYIDKPAIKIGKSCVKRLGQISTKNQIL